MNSRDITVLGLLTPCVVLCSAARLALSNSGAGRFIDVRTYPFPQARVPELRPLELRIDASLARGGAERCSESAELDSEGASWRVDSDGRLHLTDVCTFRVENERECPCPIGRRVEIVLEHDGERWSRASARAAQWIDVAADRWWRELHGRVTLSSDEVGHAEALLMRCELRDAADAREFGQVREPIDATWALAGERAK